MEYYDDDEPVVGVRLGDLFPILCWLILVVIQASKGDPVGVLFCGAFAIACGIYCRVYIQEDA